MGMAYALQNSKFSEEGNSEGKTLLMTHFVDGPSFYGEYRGMEGVVEQE
ncbi:hypothetical protein L915_08858 [Phytophthora nicotianae]|uniref:Uncharacterized protein n=1 Tax=Phytophthora nicotianae TaxID=4792 RepID=W2GUH8_PHYNI|nr:hypothetical protein L915_08858 [Phytophthora nicotianae]